MTRAFDPERWEFESDLEAGFFGEAESAGVCPPWAPVSVENPGGGRVKDKRIPAASDLVLVKRAFKGMVPLHRLAAAALEALQCAARNDGLKPPLLQPTSGFRDPKRQKEIWDRAVIKYGSPQEANKWAGRPGSSAHQSGRAIDFFLGGKNDSHNVDSLRRLPAYRWLLANAPRFGFYPYEREPWHWEYNPPASGHPGLFPELFEPELFEMEDWAGSHDREVECEGCRVGSCRCRHATPRRYEFPVEMESAAKRVPGCSGDDDVRATLRMAARQAPGLGITLEQLLVRHKAEWGGIPIEVLLAFIHCESGNHLNNDATAGKWSEKEKRYIPEFYELGIFQTPAGDHGCVRDGGVKRCSYEPPGFNVNRSSFGKGWHRLTGTYPTKADWTNPDMQVRIGLWNLNDMGQRVAKKFPQLFPLFPSRISEWYLRMAVLYSFSKGPGWTLAFLSKYRNELLVLPEGQRWDFLRGKSAELKRPGRKPVSRMFSPENVNERMALAAKLRAARGATAPSAVGAQPEFEQSSPRRSAPAPPKTGSRPATGHWLPPFASNAIPKYKGGGGGLQSTASSIYVPDAAWKQQTIDLIVFFHGDPGPCSSIFDPNPKNISRKFGLDAQIDDSGRKVAIAVPTVYWIPGQSANVRGVWTAAHLNQFVDEVLAEIGKQSGVRPTLGRLIIAGHSHAFAILTPLACEFGQDAPATKTGASARLGEVWALDSTYGQVHVHALEVWARKIASGRFIAVLSRGGREKGPLSSWNGYYNTQGYCMSGFIPPNLKMCAVNDSHCAIPAKHVRSLLSGSSSWC